MRASCSSCARGQAAVEAALVLPLVVFLVLGTLQLFLMLQARELAQYAAFWAAREGSVTQSNCKDMKRVALMALLPSFAQVRNDRDLKERVERIDRNGFHYDSREGAHVFDGDVFWLLRDRPLRGDVRRALEEQFDQGGAPMRLEVRLVFWYPMRIPFANWMIAKMLRAAFGVEQFAAVNPLMPAQTAAWGDQTHRFEDAGIAAAFDRRTRKGELVFPISVTSSMRMMTPPATEYFSSQHCIPPS